MAIDEILQPHTTADDSTGELVPEPDRRPPIPSALRKRLEDILCEPRVRRPRLEAPEIARIIDGVREALHVVSVLRKYPDPARNRERFERGERKVQDLRDWLKAARTHTPGPLYLALSRLGYPGDHPERLLDVLTAVFSKAANSWPRRRLKGGRPRGGAAARVPGVPADVARQFDRDVAAVLRRHDLRPSRHVDGWFADLLATLWPHALGTALPRDDERVTDIRRLLSDALA